MSNSSYLFGYDEVSGWGARYFFAFYSEFDEERSSVTMEVFIFVCIFVLSLLANSAIAFALLKYPEMRTVNNCFLLNLTAADLAFVIGVPSLVYTRINADWTLGNFVCKALPYSQFVCSFVLLWTLSWISMDRYRCIVVPPFRSQLTPRRTILLTAITWLVALILFLPVMFCFRVQFVEDGHQICTLIFPKSDRINVSLLFTVTTVTVACALPLTLFIYHYQQIFHKLNETRDRWKRCDNKTRQLPSWDIKKPDVLWQQEEARFYRHVRVVRILLLNVLVVLLMWLPITLVMTLIYWDGRRPNEDTNFFLRSHHFIWSLQIALSNTIVNPILYGIMSENFRKCFCRMWFQSKRKKAIIKEVYDGPAVIGSMSPRMFKGPIHFTNSIPIND